MGELRGEMLGSELVAEGNRRVVGTGVGNVGEHRDGRVAREEQIVQVRGAARALERVRGAARGNHAEHELHGVGGVLGPRPVGHHMMRVHIDHELAVAAERVFARLDFVGWRHRVGAAGTRGRRARSCRTVRRRSRARCRRAARRRQIDGGEHRRDPARRLQEAAPIHTGFASRVVGVRKRGAGDVTIVARRRIRHVLAVGSGLDPEGETNLCLGVVVAPARHVRTIDLRERVRAAARPSRYRAREPAPSRSE